MPTRTKLLVNLMLHWQAVAVPAKAANDVVPSGCRVAGHNVLQAKITESSLRISLHTHLQPINVAEYRCDAYCLMANAGGLAPLRSRRRRSETEGLRNSATKPWHG